MTETEEIELIVKSTYWIYRSVSPDVRPHHYGDDETTQSWIDMFYDYYSKDAKITELGKSTTLVEIPSADYECLKIGGNEKFTRLGSLMYVNIYGSIPIELARERVQERLDKLNTNLELWGNEDECDDNGNYFDIIRDRETGDEWSQGDTIYIPKIVPKGKSLLNRNKDHYAWIRAFGKTTSIDKDMYNLLEKMEAPFNECIGCGTKVLGNKVCPVCSQKYAECSDCGEYSLIKDGEYRQGGFLCSKCKKKARCKGCGYPVANEGDKLCERCSKVRGILDYHSHLGRQDESNGSRLKVGIEIEKEDFDIRDNLNCRAILRDTGWVVERDSSLGTEGFEMVSPIYPMNIEKIRESIAPLEKEINCKTTTRCGGHIHVSDTERTPHEILLDIRGYLPLLYGLYPYRATNEYCEAKETPEYIQQGHRQAVNITDKTLEFRIFPAVKNLEQLMFRLRLVEYMLKNKETDVIKVGEALLDENSELHKLLRQRISKKNLKVKAKAFIDFTNYLDRDALVLEGTKIRRVISIPKIKLDKEKALEERVKVISENTRSSNRPNTIRTIPLSQYNYGYFATLVEGYTNDVPLPF